MVRNAREKAGLSISDIAKELNVAVGKLEAIERDQYDKLASEVFAQGYLRRYGKLVGVDDDTLVARFNDYMARQRKPDEHKVAGREQASSRPNPPRWLIPAIVFLAAVAVLAFIFVRTAIDDAKGPVVTEPEQQQEEQQQEPAQEEEPKQEEVSAPQSAPAAEAGTEAARAVSQTGNPGSLRESPGAVPVEDAMTEAAVSPPVETIPAEPLPDRNAEAAETEEVVEPTAAGSDDILSFVFSDECWVEITNANGTVIHAELANAGESLVVEGQAPFSVMLGDARAVSLSYNGEAVAVNPRPGARTLRLRVGE